MKKTIALRMALCLALAAFCAGNLAAQRKPISFHASVIKSLADPLGYRNQQVTIDFMYKDSTDHALYTETHSVTLNELAEFVIQIGKGTNQTPLFSTAAIYKAASACYTITVHDPGGDVTLMGIADLSASNFAINAESAENANSLGGNKWINNILLVDDVLNTTFSDNWGLLTFREPTSPVTNIIERIQLNNLLKGGQAPSAVDNNLIIPYACFGTGTQLPIVFSKEPQTEIENFVTILPFSANNVYNGVGIKMPAEGVPFGHSTAALYAENIFDGQGVGVYANGRSRGSFNTGQTGIFGMCNNTTGNGAGVWGFVQNPPEAGAGNYAILGSANAQPNALAGYFIGNVAYTGTLSGPPSDERLKTGIQTSALGLSTILKLRPASYQYRENQPMNLPKGEHHGFIAQELEQVLPELVEELNLPASLDPDKMSDGGAVTYKSINYIEIIPILTKAIQDLNDKVEAQAAEIVRLDSALKACKLK